jgi:diacylglycerol kinase family enzyme
MLPAIHVVANSRSGTAAGASIQDIVQRLRDLGHEVTLDDDDRRPLGERTAAAAAAPAGIVLAAGGDGTITAVAGALLGTGKTMAILPLGTANLLARDLGVPLEAEAWLTAFPTMAPRRIDVGTVNDRAFLHKVVIGFAPAIAAGRERLRGKEGPFAMLPLLGFLIRRFFRSRRMALEFVRDDWEVRFARVQAVAVANNAYDEQFGHFFSRKSLEGGSLSLYLLRHLRIRDAVRLSARMLLGRWNDDEVLDVEQATTLTIRGRRQRVKAMVDGEVDSLLMPLRFEIKPMALPILAPPPAEEAASETGEHPLAIGA